MTRPTLALTLALLAAGCASTAPVRTLGEGRTGTMTLRSATLGGASAGAVMPAYITADLTLPRAATGRVPAVIVLHSCTGVRPNLRDWARELNVMGYGAFVVDSFEPRGVEEVCTGRSQVTIPSRLVDAYRALAVLATHPRIDPERIAVMGFSHGGWVVLWASHTAFQQRLKEPGTPQFAAYLAIYPAGCNARLRDETDVSGGPIAVFHGTADDWTPIAQCAAFVERLRAAGREASLVAYDGAPHAFDVPMSQTSRHLPDVLNTSGCTVVQQADGRFLDAEGQPITPSSSCVTRGASIGYDASAHRRLIGDVKAFLADAFARGR